MTSGYDKGTAVGVIGLGIIGSSFASNLLSRGYNNIHVYNRTAEKAQPFIEKGVTFHFMPRELASADIIMTSLTDETAVDSLAFGENELLKGAKKGCLWIDLSTIDPSASVRHAEASKKAGI